MTRTSTTSLVLALIVALVGCGARRTYASSSASVTRSGGSASTRSSQGQAIQGPASAGAAAGEPPPPDQPMPPESIGTDVVAAIGTPVSALVDGRADVFSASMSVAHAARGGVLPSRVTLPAGARSIEHTASGQVGCGTGEPTSGPMGGGCAGGSTNIESADGIAGLIDATRTQFLAGVFLAGRPLASPPERLDVAPGQPGEAASRAPALGQSFYLGAGATTTVPAGATELYLGFVDGWGFQGEPSYYADNTGGFRVTITAR